ncbi:DUF1810 domain-containing protein [Pseudomonas sp. LS-2]|uniref:DUF1810 domain-containing protein n=1 Tax=Pseudomonas sp. LS-2 TaxID=2315859 RepID=UPI000E715D0D|nr:DUF1810 domain-containing protein [Pseudomonas sp. LS-2]RJX74894.1 DUF1810 domain-containing protein [Pseudomonas sp. LS-2]
MNDSFDLSRFVEAQRPVISRVMDELRSGRKTSHWMWFVFPQLKGLGRSEIAMRFGIAGMEEARAYLAHPLLGPRLDECVQTLLEHANLSAFEIFGSPDDLKLHSCLTLFNEVHSEAALFQRALDQFFEAAPDDTTIQLLQAPGSNPAEPQRPYCIYRRSLR